MRPWLLLLCGCDRLFGLAPVAGDASVAVDVPTDAASCSHTTFDHDTFDGTTISPRWNVFMQLSTLQVYQSDAFVIDLTQAPMSPDDGEAGALTLNSHNFSDGFVSVQVPQVTGGTMFHAETHLDVFLDFKNFYAFDYNSGILQVASNIGGTYKEENSRDYSASQDRFWRIESAGSVLTFQTSQDGKAFETVTTVAAAFSLDAVHIRLVAGTFGGGEAAPGMAKFDNYELCAD
jgi:hypothetical protein